MMFVKILLWMAFCQIVRCFNRVAATNVDDINSFASHSSQNTKYPNPFLHYRPHSNSRSQRQIRDTSWQGQNRNSSPLATGRLFPDSRNEEGRRQRRQLFTGRNDQPGFDPHDLALMTDSSGYPKAIGDFTFEELERFNRNRRPRRQPSYRPVATTRENLEGRSFLPSTQERRPLSEAQRQRARILQENREESRRYLEDSEGIRTGSSENSRGFRPTSRERESFQEVEIETGSSYNPRDTGYSGDDTASLQDRLRERRKVRQRRFFPRRPRPILPPPSPPPSPPTPPSPPPSPPPPASPPPSPSPSGPNTGGFPQRPGSQSPPGAPRAGGRFPSKPEMLPPIDAQPKGRFDENAPDDQGRGGDDISKTTYGDCDQAQCIRCITHSYTCAQCTAYIQYPTRYCVQTCDGVTKQMDPKMTEELFLGFVCMPKDPCKTQPGCVECGTDGCQRCEELLVFGERKCVTNRGCDGYPIEATPLYHQKGYFGRLCLPCAERCLQCSRKGCEKCDVMIVYGTRECLASEEECTGERLDATEALKQESYYGRVCIPSCAQKECYWCGARGCQECDVVIEYGTRKCLPSEEDCPGPVVTASKWLQDQGYYRKVCLANCEYTTGCRSCTTRGCEECEGIITKGSRQCLATVTECNGDVRLATNEFNMKGYFGRMCFDACSHMDGCVKCGDKGCEECDSVILYGNRECLSGIRGCNGVQRAASPIYFQKGYFGRLCVDKCVNEKDCAQCGQNGCEMCNGIIVYGSRKCINSISECKGKVENASPIYNQKGYFGRICIESCQKVEDCVRCPDEETCEECNDIIVYGTRECITNERDCDGEVRDASPIYNQKGYFGRICIEKCRSTDPSLQGCLLCPTGVCEECEGFIVYGTRVCETDTRGCGQGVREASALYNQKGYFGQMCIEKCPQVQDGCVQCSEDKCEKCEVAILEDTRECITAERGCKGNIVQASPLYVQKGYFGRICKSPCKEDTECIECTTQGCEECLGVIEYGTRKCLKYPESCGGRLVNASPMYNQKGYFGRICIEPCKDKFDGCIKCSDVGCEECEVGIVYGSRECLKTITSCRGRFTNASPIYNQKGYFGRICLDPCKNENKCKKCGDKGCEECDGIIVYGSRVCLVSERGCKGKVKPASALYNQKGYFGQICIDNCEQDKCIKCGFDGCEECEGPIEFGTRKCLESPNECAADVQQDTPELNELGYYGDICYDTCAQDTCKSCGGDGCEDCGDESIEYGTGHCVKSEQCKGEEVVATAEMMSDGYKGNVCLEGCNQEGCKRCNTETGECMECEGAIMFRTRICVDKCPERGTSAYGALNDQGYYGTVCTDACTNKEGCVKCGVAGCEECEGVILINSRKCVGERGCKGHVMPASPLHNAKGYFGRICKDTCKVPECRQCGEKGCSVCDDLVQFDTRECVTKEECKGEIIGATPEMGKLGYYGKMCYDTCAQHSCIKCCDGKCCKCKWGIDYGTRHCIAGPEDCKKELVKDTLELNALKFYGRVCVDTCAQPSCLQCKSGRCAECSNGIISYTTSVCLGTDDECDGEVVTATEELNEKDLYGRVCLDTCAQPGCVRCTEKGCGECIGVLTFGGRRCLSGPEKCHGDVLDANKEMNDNGYYEKLCFGREKKETCFQPDCKRCGNQGCYECKVVILYEKRECLKSEDDCPGGKVVTASASLQQLGYYQRVCLGTCTQEECDYCGASGCERCKGVILYGTRECYATEGECKLTVVDADAELMAENYYGRVCIEREKGGGPRDPGSDIEILCEDDCNFCGGNGKCYECAVAIVYPTRECLTSLSRCPGSLITATQHHKENNFFGLVCMPTSCDNIECPEGSHCMLKEVKCVRDPCSPVPTCVFKQTCDDIKCPVSEQCVMLREKCPMQPCPGEPICKIHALTCANVLCKPGTMHCIMVPGDCEEEKCFDVPKCVSPSLTCQDLACEPPYVCVMKEEDCGEYVCPKHPKCVPTLTCRNVRCSIGHICKMVPGECDSPPCPQEPKCVPIDQTCASVTCPIGYICVIKTVPCLVPPCPKKPGCVPDIPPPPPPSGCEVVKCQDGYKCVMKHKPCGRPPCPKTPVCVPDTGQPNPPGYIKTAACTRKGGYVFNSRMTCCATLATRHVSDGARDSVCCLPAPECVRDNGCCVNAFHSRCSTALIPGKCPGNKLCCIPRHPCERHGGLCIDQHITRCTSKYLQKGMCGDREKQCCIDNICGEKAKEFACKLLDNELLDLYDESDTKTYDGSSPLENLNDMCEGKRAVTCKEECPNKDTCISVRIMMLLECLTSLCGEVTVIGLAGDCRDTHCNSQCTGKGVNILLTTGCDINHIDSICEDMEMTGTVVRGKGNEPDYFNCSFM